MSPDGPWPRRDPGSAIPPGAAAGGGTEPADDDELDLVAAVVATGQPGDGGGQAELTPGQRRILARCGSQATVADLAADLGLPVGEVRQLLADLIERGVVAVVPRQPAGQRTRDDVLQEILYGLHGL